MAKSMKISRRYVFVDIAKVVGTFLVVFGHLLSLDNEARHFIYLFHMPFFFFVSGMLFRPSNFRNEIYKDFRRILVPAFFFIALAIVLHSWNNFKYESTQAMISIIFGGRIKANPIVWFLFVLCNLRLWCCLWLNNRKVAVFILMISLFVLFKNALFIAQTLMALPFFFGGYYSKSGIFELVNSMNKGKKLFFGGICVGILFFVLQINGRVSMQQLLLGNAPYGLSVILFYLGGFIGTFMLLILSSCVNCNIKAIEYTSSSLITVVGMQTLFIKLYKHFFGFGQSWTVIIIASCIIIIICVLFHMLLSKYFPFLYNNIVNNEK